MPNRQQKREETRRRILAETGRLVDAHGYENVTVDEICAASNISRRSFFNYMESKDQAVLGPTPFQFTDASLEKIRSTQSDNVLALLIEAMEIVPEGNAASASQHRRRLIEANPDLLHQTMAHHQATLAALTTALIEHFQRYPGDRKLPGSDATEAHAIIALFRCAAGEFLGNPRPEGNPIEQICQNVKDLTKFTMELSW